MLREFKYFYAWRGLGLVALGLAAMLFGLALATPAQAQAPQSQVRVLQSDANRVILELEVAGYAAREQRVGGATYTALAISGFGHTNEPGKPQLPIQGALVGIPPGAQAALKIVADDTQRDALTYPPLPAPTARVQTDPRQTLPQNTGLMVAPNAAAYSANQFYPADAARIASVGDWRSQHYVSVEFHPLQYNAATRQLVFHRRLRVEVTLSYPRGMSAQALGNAVNEGPFESVFQQALVNYSTAKNWRARPTSALPAPKRAPKYSGGPWYKIAVNADGMYTITCADLESAGIDLATLDPRTLRIFKQGTELAIQVVGQDAGVCDKPNDYLFFFAQAPQAKYSNTNLYWLTYGGATGKRIAARAGSGTNPAASFTQTVHLESNLLYRPYLPLGIEDAEHWYWDYLAPAPAYSKPSLSSTFQVSYPAAGSFSATLEIALFGFTTQGHHTQLYINDNLIDDSTWSGQVERRATISFAQSLLSAGANTVRVTELNDLDPADLIFVNYFNVSYASAFSAVNDALRFRQTTNDAWQYSITGFTTSDAQLFDLTDPFNIAPISNATVTSPCPCTLQFADTLSAPHEYLALTPAQFKSPLSITRDTLSDLRNPSNGADYIIITYGGFSANVQPLANHRAAQGLRVKVVDAQDVYDEFNDGLMDPQAIRDFLAYTFTNAQWQPPAPSFVLLVGDGTFDPKGYCLTGCPGVPTPPNSTFLPPFLRMVDPWNGETASDNRLVAFNDGTGNTLPNMAVGRLPANNPAEVDAMVAKILAYEQNPPSDWQTRVSFISDDPDDGGDFWHSSDLIANNPQYLPTQYGRDRIYYGQAPYTDPTTTHDAALSAINDGRFIVNFIGHSFIYFWTDSQPPILHSSDVDTLTNGNKLPIMLEMTCYTGYFQYPGLAGLAETNVRAANKGALASWAASGLGISTGHDYLDQGFFRALMWQGVRQIGPAAVLGLTNLWTNGGGANRDLIDTFHLFGDPATRVPIYNTGFYLPFVRRQ